MCVCVWGGGGGSTGSHSATEVKGLWAPLNVEAWGLKSSEEKFKTVLWIHTNQQLQHRQTQTAEDLPVELNTGSEQSGAAQAGSLCLKPAEPERQWARVEPDRTEILYLVWEPNLSLMWGLGHQIPDARFGFLWGVLRGGGDAASIFIFDQSSAHSDSLKGSCESGWITEQRDRWGHTVQTDAGGSLLSPKESNAKTWENILNLATPLVCFCARNVLTEIKGVYCFTKWT